MSHAEPVAFGPRSEEYGNGLCRTTPSPLLNVGHGTVALSSQESQDLPAVSSSLPKWLTEQVV